jgi:lipid II:glycine glycyltransferase (peptidoglycan interpeptide bridge formation enzyme)
LNTYIDLNEYKDEILSNFEQGKRTNVHNCIKEGLALKKIETDDQLSEFYNLLCQTLSKYNQRPVHTIAEIRLLKEERISNEIELYGIYKEDEMLAGSMMFLFENTKCMHAQYLAAKPGYERLSPMTYAYYAMIEESKKMGYRYVSWGISTEHDGTINYGLTKSKEAYGSYHSLNRIFVKDL